MVRGIRGATTVEANHSAQIREATQELLQTLVKENKLLLEDLVSAIFTVTPDLNAEFPASFAREIGWDRVPLICSTEIPVQGAMPLCIRVLLHVNTELSQKQVRHVYLRRAVGLRKDLAAQ
ncbi:MAG: chorismate mutase [Desulfitobacteriaceae bacterium]|nr:chorismate mutase [Desulfitobacteriaceae bacterium]MDI6878855.1 chorismate mutase [Desulfitobacteriaceae bacterium]MDI6914592.1 chorismate mutase [Desulfitobacteriaceae bacterium]